MSEELYKKYRPKKLDEVIGQTEAVQILKSFAKKGKIPHAILLHGPPGCGKTTLARIIATKVDSHPKDVIELNTANFKGIDTVRDIQSKSALSGLRVRRVWIVDECHKLTNDAQSAFLKLLEDTPKHVYILLCTSEPDKVLAAARSRCTEIRVNPLSTRELQKLIGAVAAEEKLLDISDDVMDKLVEKANGSARKALVLLEQIAELKDEDSQLKTLSTAGGNEAAIEIARALIQKQGWSAVSKLIKGCEKEDPEGIRQLILAYSTSVLLGGGKLSARAHQIIEVFRDAWYQCGKAGLAASCYEIVHTK